MTIDKDASYYDLDIHNVGIVETDQLVRCILERAGLTAHASHRLGVLIERIARLGAKPGTDVQREVGKIAIEAGMLRDSVLWDQPLSEALAELREIHAKTEWAQMDDPVGELMRMRHGDEETPDPAARIAELERARDEARSVAQETLMQSQSWQLKHREVEAERDRWRASFDRVEADLMALRKTLDTERQAAVATAEELERVRRERDAQAQRATDAEAAFRRERTRADALHAELSIERRELAALRGRYRPRRQSEEPAPDGAPIMRWNATTMRWQPSYGYELRPDHTWTHQPPAPGEGE